MDTSDGVIAALDQLMQLNDIGFELDPEWESVLTPNAKKITHACKFPPWFMLAGYHGEFELLFTIPPEGKDELMTRAKEAEWQPLRLGKVMKRRECVVPLNGRKTVIDTQRIRNMSLDGSGNIREYINELRKLDNELQKGTTYHDDQ